MKKALCIFMLFTLSISLCGCSDYSEVEDSYIISAIGFDRSKDDYMLIIESTNGEEKKTFSAEGKDYEDAFLKMKQGLVKDVDFGHTACLLLREGLAYEEQERALDFCKRRFNFSQYSVVVLAKEPQKILDAKSYDIAIGYDILNILKNNNQKAKRLYEVSAGSKIDSPTLYLSNNGIAIEVNANV